MVDFCTKAIQIILKLTGNYNERMDIDIYVLCRMFPVFELNEQTSSLLPCASWPHLVQFQTELQFYEIWQMFTLIILIH